MLCMKQRARQREFGFTNWGGKRRGAGRKPKGERAGVSHERRPELKERHPVLVTMRLVAGLPSLRCDTEHALVRAALAASSGTSFQVVSTRFNRTICTCSSRRRAGASCRVA